MENKKQRPRKPLQALKITNHVKVQDEGQSALKTEITQPTDKSTAYQGTAFNNRNTDEWGYWEQLRRR